MIVAVIALVVALGGVGYAAVSLPAGSVGTRQLQDGSVSTAKLRVRAVGARKIASGAVGRREININQVQQRVAGVCGSGAITSISPAGSVTCGAAPGGDVYTPDVSPVRVGTSATQITAQTLPAGDAFVLSANPLVVIDGITQTGVTGATGTPESIQVDCTIAAGPNEAATQTRSLQVDVGANSQTQTLPLIVAVPAGPSRIRATLSCSMEMAGAIAPTVLVTSSLNALQTAANFSEPYGG